MIEKFENILKSNFSKNLKKEQILVAVSGGVDSMVLCSLFHTLAYQIHIVCCDFGLRAKSSAEVDFVRNWARDKNKPFYTQKFDVRTYVQENKCSIQMAARDLRYVYFEKIRQQNNLQWIATAHHLDDSLETFLINLGRASGLKGLTGIPQINGNIIRPLLAFSKQELIDFAREKNIVWQEDDSNQKTVYLRNQIRHCVVPALKKTQPNFLKGFAQTLTLLKEHQESIAHQTASFKKKILQKKDEHTYQIHLSALENLPKVKIFLYPILKNFGFTNWKDIENMSLAKTGKQLFSTTHRLIKNRNTWLLTSLKNSEDNVFYIEKDTLKIEAPLPMFFEKSSLQTAHSKKVIYVNADALKFPLILRKWHAGDRFYPFGMQGSKKKVSKFFKDEKYSLIEKQQAFILCNNDQKIIWIVGSRADERFRVKADTKNVLKIYI